LFKGGGGEAEKTREEKQTKKKKPINRIGSKFFLIHNLCMALFPNGFSPTDNVMDI
jgi:hypothetical protein